jgi:hypothetical protein
VEVRRRINLTRSGPNKKMNGLVGFGVDVVVARGELRVIVAVIASDSVPCVDAGLRRCRRWIRFTGNAAGVGSSELHSMIH